MAQKSKIFGTPEGVKKTTIVMTILLLLATMAVAQTAEVRPEGVPVLVYGQVIINEQSEECSWNLRSVNVGDGMQYTIATYDPNDMTKPITVREGTVGTMKEGYIFESQNDVNNDEDKVVITVYKGNLTQKLTKTISHQENYQSFMDFGQITLEGTEREECKIPKKKEGELFIHTVQFISGEYLVIGEELITNIMLDNVGEAELEQVKINVLIQDLGVWRTVGPVDIDADDSVNRDVYVEVPYWAQPGDYDVRITVTNDDMKRVVYRIMTVEG
jgi:hypothetical protein